MKADLTFSSLPLLSVQADKSMHKATISTKIFLFISFLFITMMQEQAQGFGA